MHQTQAEVDATFEKEWDRTLLTTLGVAGKRVYEMRLQTPVASFEKNAVRDVLSYRYHFAIKPGGDVAEVHTQASRPDVVICCCAGPAQGHHGLVPVQRGGAAMNR